MKTVADFLERYPTLSRLMYEGEYRASSVMESKPVNGYFKVALKGQPYDFVTFHLDYLDAFWRLHHACKNNGYNRPKKSMAALFGQYRKEEKTMLALNSDEYDNDMPPYEINNRKDETMIKAEEIADILTDNLRYVDVKYPNTISKTYIFKVPTEVGELVVGDKVVVGNETGGEGFNLVEVVAIYNNYNEVPADKKSHKFKYIINKIDFTPYSNAIKLEKEIIDFVNVKQREAIRNQLREAVTAQFPELQKFVALPNATAK